MGRGKPWGEETRGAKQRERGAAGFSPPSPLNPSVLAQNGYFDDPAFLAYLDHLAYWRTPAYARFLTYPHALFALDLLASPAFRRAVGRPAVAEQLHGQQLWFWQGWRANRAAEAARARGAAGG